MDGRMPAKPTFCLVFFVKRILVTSAAMLMTAALGARFARADIFVLQSGGQVRGELANPNQSPRKSYIVKTPGGGQITLEARQVAEVKHQNAAELKYDQISATYPDTVEGQWKLAEWCRENHLPKQRKTHLERVVELDPNHANARHALGYSQIQGRWVTQEKLMTENGYIRYKGSWVLPQEIELLEQQGKEKKAQLEWSTKLNRWQTWFDTEKAEQAETNIKAIDDPFAARALVKHLEREQRRDIRMLYVEALGRLNAAAGMAALVDSSLYDADDEVRLSALDQVVTHNYKPAVGRYVQALKSRDNPIINRAASCLAQMKDPTAIGPLIGALVTVHTFEIQKGQPGQMSAGFGSGPGTSGGAFTFGGSNTETRQVVFENRDVLQALVSLTNGTTFNYDVAAWKYWFAAQKKPTTMDARRDEKSP
jgi:hypothetical protein